MWWHWWWGSCSFCKQLLISPSALPDNNIQASQIYKGIHHLILCQFPHDVSFLLTLLLCIRHGQGVVIPCSCFPDSDCRLIKTSSLTNGRETQAVVARALLSKARTSSSVCGHHPPITTLRRQIWPMGGRGPGVMSHVWVARVVCSELLWWFKLRTETKAGVIHFSAARVQN